jgi:ribonuclease P protein component
VRRVLAAGRRARRDHFDIYWSSNEAGFPRLGLIVPKLRHNGVERNRLRRRLKEVWRRDVARQLPAWDVVVRARQESYGLTFESMRAELVSWCQAAAQ